MAGNATQPSAQSAADALQGVTFNPDLTENLSGVFDSTAPDAYALSAYSYFVTQCVPKQARRRTSLATAAARSP